MKNFKVITLGIILALSLNFSLGATTVGHELLPKQLEEFLNKNPNATAEQIQEFFSQNPDVYKGDSHYRERLINAIKAPQKGVWHIIPDFIKLGVAHVLSGIDHILFVASLLLVFIAVSEILKLTSTFTIAHSITLILAVLALLTVPAKVTEPIIAFSISYVALTSVFLKKYNIFRSVKNKIVSVFFFGLFHGMGFASALQEISIPKEAFVISLLSFNVGVEIAQVIIVALVLPFILLLRYKPWYNNLINVLATVLGLTGITWGLQRIIQSLIG